MSTNGEKLVKIGAELFEILVGISRFFLHCKKSCNSYLSILYG